MSAQSASVDETEDRPSLPLAASIHMMLASMAAIILAFSLAFFTPTAFGLTACVALYGLVVLQELRYGVFAPTSLTVLAVYSGFATLVWTGVDPNGWLHMIAPVLFGALAVVTGSMLAFGKPFSVVYSRGSGLYSIHTVGSAVWVAGFVLAAVTSYALQPSVWFIFAPLIIIMVVVAIMAVINFVWFGPKNMRQKKFELGGLTFEQVERTEENMSVFYDIIGSEFWQVAKRDKKNLSRGVTRKVLREKFVEHDEEYHKYNTYFFARDGEEVIGVICFHHDNDEIGLPVEQSAKISLDGLRKRGKIGELDLISVVDRYKMRNDAFVGLVKCGLDIAHELCLDFICIESFPSRQGLYKKVGFANLTENPHTSNEEQYGFALPMQPMVVNIGETLATAAEDRSLSADALGEALNLYLAERAAKRMVLRDLFKFRKTPNWKLDADSIRAIVAQ